MRAFRVGHQIEIAGRMQINIARCEVSGCFDDFTSGVTQQAINRDKRERSSKATLYNCSQSLCISQYVELGIGVAYGDGIIDQVSKRLKSLRSNSSRRSERGSEDSVHHRYQSKA